MSGVTSGVTGGATSGATSGGWEMVVGLEVHAQLKTATKAFCRCSTTFGDAPNTNTCPVCLGLPGALPVLNAGAVSLAVRAALALGCTVHERSVFARKNYFYPDLPKGYQISQFDRPLATGGALSVQADGKEGRVGITRVHMEEDAGKSIHDRYAAATAIDLNRAGVPLIEIVSEPDIRSSAAAGAYLRLLKQILEYTDVSDVSMEEGSLRVDANVSARRTGERTLGTKTEVKNLNSFSAVERALDAEFARQVATLEAGGQIEQMTLLWDGAKNEVRPARTKEGSHDYRYFPEPDLPPLVVAAVAIAQAKRELPQLPDAAKAEFIQLGLSATAAAAVTATASLARFAKPVIMNAPDRAAAANWIMGEFMRLVNERKLDLKHIAETSPIKPERIGELVRLQMESAVSASAAKQVFAELANGDQSPRAIAERLNLLQVGDDGQLATWVDEVFAENANEAARFVGGERKLQGVLVGLVMRKSKGRADPKKVNQLLAARVRA